MKVSITVTFIGEVPDGTDLNSITADLSKEGHLEFVDANNMQVLDGSDVTSYTTEDFPHDPDNPDTTGINQ